MQLQFIDLIDPEEMMIAHNLVSQLYPDLSKEKYGQMISEMHETNGFQMCIAILDGKIVCVCGYWVLTMLYCGKYLQISNLVVDENVRGHGIGKEMLKHLENKARKLKCEKFILDSYTENKKSHKLYFSQGFYIRGFHFMKDL